MSRWASPTRPPTLSGQCSGEITRDYIGAFFDLRLRVFLRPPLDGPTPANPEMVFQHP
ncbi:hypothetical protein ABT063_25205 [Streptomyces sp. NPDC002838]|uniref:hypothetical protein n=1 Tax=Streptomyces sp. NPDC002838 TaxID=3154436 RepID=UPI0033247371